MPLVDSTQLPHTLASQNQHTHTKSGNEGPDWAVWIIAVPLANCRIPNFYEDSEKESLGARWGRRYPAPRWSSASLI